jgi:hypothetical protein
MKKSDVTIPEAMPNWGSILSGLQGRS